MVAARVCPGSFFDPDTIDNKLVIETFGFVLQFLVWTRSSPARDRATAPDLRLKSAPQNMDNTAGRETNRTS